MCIKGFKTVWNAIFLYLKTKVLFKLMVQFKGLTGQADIVTLL